VLRFSANLTMLYGEHPFVERFAAAARDGFHGVEFSYPYEHPAEELAARAADAGVETVLFNFAHGEVAAGERGISALPGREDDFARSLETALEYARAMKCTRLHAMAGIVAPAERDAAARTFRANLARAAARAASEGVTITIEPINQRDIPGYFLNRQADAHAIVAELGAPNLKVQMDFYHAQIVEGDVIATLQRYLPAIGHLQCAGVPERHEPDSGELDYAPVFAAVAASAYAGWVGAEYRPRGQTSAGLGWLRALAPQAGSTP
jgi:hydroxypyruvate isomerase